MIPSDEDLERAHNIIRENFGMSIYGDFYFQVRKDISQALADERRRVLEHEAVKKLIRYGEHISDCEFYIDPRFCNCGYEKAFANFQKLKEENR